MSLTPDVFGYRDLELDARTADDLLADGLDLATTRLPGWAPRAGNTEYVLLEAIALMVAEEVYHLNQLPGVLVEGVVRLLGVQRSAGTSAAATARFLAADAAGHTVPIGTRVSVEQGASTVVLVTTEALTIPAGRTSGDVVVRALTAGAAANGAPAGSPASVIDAVPFLERAQLVTELAGGADAEGDESYAARGLARAARITTTLVLPSHFATAALEADGVTRALTVDLFDPRQQGVPGSHLGHVTVAVAGPGGTALPAATMEQLAARLDEQAVAGLTIHVVAPTVTQLAVSARVSRLPGYSPEEVREAVRVALSAYLSPDRWPWRSTVARNELIPVVDGAAGVDLVLDLDPDQDVQLPGVAPLVQLGAVTVVVEG